MAPLQQKQREYTATDLAASLKFVQIEHSGREDRDKDSPPWWPCLWFVNAAEMRGVMAKLNVCNDSVRRRDIFMQYTRLFPNSLNCPVALLLGDAAPQRCLFDVNPSEHPLTTVPLADHLFDFNGKYISHPQYKNAVAEILIIHQAAMSGHKPTLNPPSEGPITIAAADATAGTTDTVFPQESRPIWKLKSVSLEPAIGTEYERMDSDCGVPTQAKAAPSNKQQSPHEDWNMKNKRLIAVADTSDKTLSEGSDGCDHQTMRYSSTATPLVHRAGHEKKKETPFTRHMTMDLTDQDDSRWNSPNDKILQSKKVPPSSTIGNGPTVKSKAKEGHISVKPTPETSDPTSSIAKRKHKMAAKVTPSLAAKKSRPAEELVCHYKSQRTQSSVIARPDDQLTRAGAGGPALTNIFKPDKDVVLDSKENTGYQRYRELVLSLAVDYKRSDNDEQRNLFVQQIADRVENEWGGRFLLPVELFGRKAGVWRIASEAFVLEIVRESFRDREWSPRQGKFISNSGSGMPKRMLWSCNQAAPVQDVMNSIGDVGSGRCRSTCNQAGDTDSKQAQRCSHSSPATSTVTSIWNDQHGVVTAGSSHGQDKDVKYADSNQYDGDNGDFSPLNPSISLMRSSGERYNAAVLDDSLLSTVEATGEGGGQRASDTRSHGEPDSAQVMACTNDQLTRTGAGGPASTNRFNPDKDVILGYEENEGCQRYRELVLSRAAEYQCSENWNKILIVHQVMNRMEELGARFLLPVEGNSELWRIAARTSVCEIVRESFCGCEWVPRKRKLVSDNGRGLPKKLWGVDEAAAAVHDVTESIGSGSTIGSRSTCNQAGDADSKQPQRRSHNSPARTNTSASIPHGPHCTTVSSERCGLDKTLKYTDSSRDKHLKCKDSNLDIDDCNGDILLMNSSISPVRSNGEGNETSALDRLSPITLGVATNWGVGDKNINPRGEQMATTAAAAHDAIAIGGTGSSILGDAVPKQPQGHSHNNPFGATACTSSQRYGYGLDTDMKHTDSKHGNGESLLVNSSISGSNGEDNEAAAFDDALPWTLGVGDKSSNVAVVIVRLVVNCIIPLVRLVHSFIILGFTAYGVVAFVLTVNWYLNLKGK
jgi:hypothetical protein